MISWFKKLWKEYKILRLNDPVINCKVHKVVGCAHIDGMCCDMNNCDILEDFKRKNVHFLLVIIIV